MGLDDITVAPRSFHLDWRQLPQHLSPKSVLFLRRLFFLQEPTPFPLFFSPFLLSIRPASPSVSAHDTLRVVLNEITENANNIVKTSRDEVVLNIFYTSLSEKCVVCQWCKWFIITTKARYFIIFVSDFQIKTSSHTHTKMVKMVWILNALLITIIIFYCISKQDSPSKMGRFKT